MSTGYTTSFPDGPGLGASWDKSLMRAVGAAVGTEARAVHNNETGSVRPTGVNGMGLTLYGPNMNLVRDPRCKCTSTLLVLVISTTTTVVGYAYIYT